MSSSPARDAAPASGAGGGSGARSRSPSPAAKRSSKSRSRSPRRSRSRSPRRSSRRSRSRSPRRSRSRSPRRSSRRSRSRSPARGGGGGGGGGYGGGGGGGGYPDPEDGTKLYIGNLNFDVRLLATVTSPSFFTHSSTHADILLHKQHTRQVTTLCAAPLKSTARLLTSTCPRTACLASHGTFHTHATAKALCVFPNQH